jgi:hypothetical protein
VPEDVVPGDDYQVVGKCFRIYLACLGNTDLLVCTVFGDSGNYSPTFSIVAA